MADSMEQESSKPMEQEPSNPMEQESSNPSVVKEVAGSEEQESSNPMEQQPNNPIMEQEPSNPTEQESSNPNVVEEVAGSEEKEPSNPTEQEPSNPCVAEEVAGSEEKEPSKPMEQEPSNPSVVEEVAGSEEKEPSNPMEQESSNPSVVEEVAGSEEQPLKVSVDKGLLKQIFETLKEQVSKSVKQLKESAEGKIAQEASGHPSTVVPLAIVRAEDIDASPNTAQKKRGRRPTTKIIGEIHVSFELPEICVVNNIDLDKLTQSGEETSQGNDARKLSVIERLKNWNIQQRVRGTGISDVYYYHLNSQQKFRSVIEVVHFMVGETYPPKPIGKRSKHPCRGSASHSSTRKRKRCSLVGRSEIQNDMMSYEEVIEFCDKSSENLGKRSWNPPKKSKNEDALEAE